MDKSKLILIGIIVALAGFLIYKKNQKKYFPINYSGVVYKHISASEVNNVFSHFYTVEGIDIENANGFIQIIKWDKLSERQLQSVVTQISQARGLQPLKYSTDQHFGIKDGFAAYMVHRRDSLIMLLTTPRDGETDEDLLKGASSILDEIFLISTDI